VSKEIVPGYQVAAEQILDETIGALTVVDADRLEALLQSLENHDSEVTCPSSAVHWQRALAKHRLLRQLLGETAGNLRLLRRILSLDRATVYGYGEELCERRIPAEILDRTAKIEGQGVSAEMESPWLR
jgi:hypothetical protein